MTHALFLPPAPSTGERVDVVQRDFAGLDDHGVQVELQRVAGCDDTGTYAGYTINLTASRGAILSLGEATKVANEILFLVEQARIDARHH